MAGLNDFDIVNYDELPVIPEQDSIGELDGGPLKAESVKESLKESGQSKRKKDLSLFKRSSKAIKKGLKI